MEKNNVPTTVHVEKVQGGDNEILYKVESDNEFSDKVECDNENVMKKVYGDTKIIHVEVGDIIVSAVLAKVQKLGPRKLDLEKLVKQPLLLNEYLSSVANVVVPNPKLTSYVCGSDFTYSVSWWKIDSQHRERHRRGGEDSAVDVECNTLDGKSAMEVAVNGEDKDEMREQ
ncbi:hypothetical protein QYF36_012949 [Acer negundo]|nr:hypothetical protein QYF36_012949 [Acer negundo]